MFHPTVVTERRQGPRRFLLVRLNVRGRTRTGEFFEESTMSEQVSVDGGCFCSWMHWDIGSRITISSTDQSFIEDAVVRSVRPSQDGSWKIGFQFLNVVPDWILNHSRS